MNMFSLPDSSAISMLAPSMVPMMRQPFIWNFMLLVPLASVPAVLMCCDSSEAAASRGRRKDQQAGDRKVEQGSTNMS
jgi:hypothetical protein